VQLRDQLAVLETDLQESAAQYFRECREVLPGAELAQPPEFPRADLEQSLVALEPPLEVSRVVLDAFTSGVRSLQLPMFGAIGCLAVALGAVLAGKWPGSILVALAGAVLLFVVLLAVMLRQNVIAIFGHRFTENRAALLAALDPHLRSAIERFYAALAPALDTRAGELAGEMQRHEPLLGRLQQIEETLTRIEADLRTGLTRAEPAAPPAADSPAT
jgi:hypothetical protein